MLRESIFGRRFPFEIILLSQFFLPLVTFTLRKLIFNDNRAHWTCTQVVANRTIFTKWRNIYSAVAWDFIQSCLPNRIFE